MNRCDFIPSSGLAALSAMILRPSLVFTFLAVAVLQAADIQVSPELTLSQALQQLREVRKSGDTAPATINLPEGIMELTQPPTLEAQDSNLTVTGTNSTFIGAPKLPERHHPRRRQVQRICKTIVTK